MPAVACIDHRDGGTGRRNHRRPLFGMTHGTDVRIAGDDPDGVGNTFSFGSGRGTRVGKPKYLTAQIQHGGFKTEACPGARLIKAGCQLFAFTNMGVTVHMLFHIIGQGKELFQLSGCKIQRTHKMSHG